LVTQLCPMNRLYMFSAPRTQANALITNKVFFK